MHGRLPYEVSHLIELVASPEQALCAVTTEAARAARIADTVGSLALSMTADILIVTDCPHQHPETLMNPIALIKGGEVVFHE